MPTPVSNARACLAAEGAAALDDAVAVARRRAHAQTTSLHVVYALLLSSGGGSPSPAAAGRGGGGGGGSSTSCSILRDALSRARSSAYSPRLQFKALELCFGVALDRLPSSSSGTAKSAEGGGAGDEPPVSNSLMAAIKRSQANQRRNPDTFHLYQQQQQSAAAGGATSFSGVKVELQQLVLAILDDPVVSRVFGDAGFRSTDIKLAILRPPPPILRFPRAARCPPLFLCNFSARDGFEAALTSRGLVFPFAAAAGQLCSDGSDENCRRIGEILARKNSGRNPMLVGVGAGEAARDFARAVERQNWAVLPPELREIKFVSIEKEVAELGGGGGEKLAVRSQLEELGKKAESSGVVLNIGDLKGMVEGSAECDEQEICMVSELTRMLEINHGRLWVMGWSATYETYMKFLSKHPMLDKDWDLQLLPITSIRTSMGGAIPRSSSLMESFVPFGGFIPAAYESKGQFSSVYPSVCHYEHCNDKYEQEVAVTVKDHSASVDDQQNDNLPFWLRKGSMVSLSDGHEAAKAKDDKTLLNAKIVDLHKNWNDNCQHPDHDRETTNTNDSPAMPCSVNGSGSCISNLEMACNQSKENPDEAQNQGGFEISFPISAGTQKVSMGSKSMSLPSLSELGNKDLLSKLQVRLSRSEQFQREGIQSHQADDHASPCSVTSVVTDLVLGTPHEPSCHEENPAFQMQKDNLQEFSHCLPPMKLGIVKGNGSDVPVESFAGSRHQESQAKIIRPLVLTRSFSRVSNNCASTYDKPSLISSGTCQTFDLSNYKSFCTSLVNKVGRQEEAASTISEAILRCKTRERRRGAIRRGDIWLNFHGPDKLGKKKMAVALAEMICGSKENFICIDLSYPDTVSRSRTICAQLEADGNNAPFRGKMTVDRIAQELSRKPQSILFLENVDKADLLVQNSLSQAISTGKFPDSHGREFSTNNSIFILTSVRTQGQTCERKDYTSFSEETILAACRWQMKILVEPYREVICSPKANKISFSSSPNSRSNQAYLHSVFLSRPKLAFSNDCRTQHEPLMSAKRANKGATVIFDLNLPVEEAETNDNNSTSHEDCSTSGNSEAWMEDLFELVDATVDFKPFDFDALADSMLQEVSKIFHSAAGTDCYLEIEPKVMEEMLAVAWSLEDRGALNDWFEQVLGWSFVEARRRRHSPLNRSILRLVACEDAFSDEHAPGVLLPSRIILD